MSDFHLRQFIREVFNDSTASDPKSLAKEVLHRLDEADSWLALEQAMPLVCQNFLSTNRPSLASMGDSYHENVGAVGSVSRRPRMSSWKNRGLTDYWMKKLEKPFAYAPREWKPLGDCTVEILERMAGWREQLANANLAEASGAREWIDLLQEYKVTTIRELPHDVLRNRLAGSAAA